LHEAILDRKAKLRLKVLLAAGASRIFASWHNLRPKNYLHHLASVEMVGYPRVKGAEIPATGTPKGQTGLLVYSVGVPGLIFNGKVFCNAHSSCIAQVVYLHQIAGRLSVLQG